VALSVSKRVGVGLELLESERDRVHEEVLVALSDFEWVSEAVDEGEGVEVVVGVVDTLARNVDDTPVVADKVLVNEALALSVPDGENEFVTDFVRFVAVGEDEGVHELVLEADLVPEAE
jgi:hypothetical protein